MKEDLINRCLKGIIAVSFVTTVYFLLGLQGFIALGITLFFSLLLFLRKYQYFREHGKTQ